MAKTNITQYDTTAANNTDIDSVNIPISTLRNYLKSKPNLIYRVAPKSMELLVKSVFSDFFECNVYHCGQSNDWKRRT